MKKTLTLILLLFSITILYSQTKIDEVISINFPGKSELNNEKKHFEKLIAFSLMPNKKGMQLQKNKNIQLS